MLNDQERRLIISYLTLRKLIGILGMLLPVACLFIGSWLPHEELKDSISAYYYSSMRDGLVGLLIGVSMFLLTYRGYDWRDKLVVIASGIAGLGIAVFPCGNPANSLDVVGLFRLEPNVTGYFHYGSTVIFFILLAVNSCFLFTLGPKEERTGSKKIRNAIYIICGIVIFASLATLGILTLVIGKEHLGTTYWTLVFETVMLLSFGFSWLVKGETLFKDKPEEKGADLSVP